MVDRYHQPGIMRPAGLATLDEASIRHDDDGYHTGTVWPQDNKRFIDGLHRHGQHARASALEEKLLRAHGQIDAEKGTAVEYFSGDPARVRINTETLVVPEWDIDGAGRRCLTGRAPEPFRQPPQEIQTWALTSYLAILAERGELKAADLFPESDRRLPAAQPTR